MQEQLAVTGPNQPEGSGCDAQKESARTFASLDFLRGWSAAAVLISHIAATVSGGEPLLKFNAGAFAVDIFMLLSGFLMMWHFFERQGMGENWISLKAFWKFYLRRFFRIAPLYYFMLILVYLFRDYLQHFNIYILSLWNITAVPGPQDPSNIPLTTANVLSHFSFIFGFIPSYIQGNFLPDWSIGLEMQFYLFFPFLALLLVRSRYIGGAIILLATHWLALSVFGVGVHAEPKLLGVFPFPTFLPLKIDCFLVGMLFAAGLFEKTNMLKRYLLLLLGLVIAEFYMKKFFLICFMFCIYEIAITPGFRFPMFAILAGWIRRFIRQKVFTFMANVSYGVYLIHIPILLLTLRLLAIIFPLGNLSPAGRFFLTISVAAPVIYTLAYLGFRFIESPGIARGRRIIKRIQ